MFKLTYKVHKKTAVKSKLILMLFLLVISFKSSAKTFITISYINSDLIQSYT